jgi:hypothetical protein
MASGGVAVLVMTMPAGCHFSRGRRRGIGKKLLPVPTVGWRGIVDRYDNNVVSADA